MFNNPKFLTGVSIVSTCGATVMSGVGTYWLMKDTETTGFKRFVKGAACYAPSAVLLGTAIGTNVASTAKAEQIASEFAVGFALYSQALAAYKQSTEKALDKEFGPKKREIFEAKRTEELAQMVSQGCERKSIKNTGKGNQLFCDVLTNTFFWSSYEAVMTDLATLDRKLHNDPFCSWVTVNEYYYELGLDPIPFGSKYGWTCALVNTFPMGAPSPDWVYVDGQRVTCGFLKFQEEPVHESVKDQYRF